MRKAVFFDRDGTLNIEQKLGYVWRWDQFKWRVGAISAIKAANNAGYLVIVVSNQAGIAHGHYTERDVHILHDAVNRELLRHAAHIDAYYFCPHHPNSTHKTYGGACDCRKPAPGLLRSAIEEYDIDVKSSFMIGDKESDVQAGCAAGLESIALRKNDNIGTVVTFLLARNQPVAAE